MKDAHPTSARAVATEDLPLAGIRVVEFSHMVMGPACGLVLADLGAEVIKIEPAGKGDNTRRLGGSGTGYFAMFSRNKKSIAIDIKSDEGRKVVRDLVKTADIFTENFRPGALDKMGFGYEALSQINPGLIYVSLKGFLAGPYEERTALDEVVQMMAGLAYMTGLPGKPMRAGASVNDVMGGMFGAIGALAALNRRNATGKGEYVTSGLFENCVFLVGQHMAQSAITEQPLQPMSLRTPAWGVYDIFETSDGAQLFLSAVTDKQWQGLCNAFGWNDLGHDARLATNTDRVAARATLVPELAQRLKAHPRARIVDTANAAGLPWADVNTPDAMKTDPHLVDSGGLVDVTLDDGKEMALPALPIGFGSARFGLRGDLPAIGADGADILADIGYSPEQVAAMTASGVLSQSERKR
ncbi:CaiB/BaiF CoA transferase family protein [Arenibacterium halophilum]|uniref:CoA transferase n=1 Tax=Arenibacterium halophilum TaxID=2583821 RepID=A0ABY2X1U5_9RHOB|nr:CaiB/BaiF CoA-transferase family protein [Arenibacterium halophilum]TMV09259.1 CoA transferase [Arenibacterium halophilum]